MNSFVLKMLACITMFIDHISYVIPADTSYLNLIGRFSFPIFAFQISEGYMHTKNLKKYFFRLILFAIISQIPFMLFYPLVREDTFVLNVIFTLLLGLLSITIYDKYNPILGLICTLVLGITANILKCDYGFYGVIIIFIFYIFKNSKIKYTIGFEFATILYFLALSFKYYKNGFDILKQALIWYLPYCFFTMLAIVPILFYNNKKGSNNRYLIYLFYPLHLLFIYIISFYIR